jgi:16S rRNA (guanine527-N7)-methyltransferase
MSLRYKQTPSVQQIQKALLPFDVSLSAEQARQVSLYLDLLLLWNQKISLTSVTQPEEILSRHFGESFFAARVVGIEEGRLADVGSGAGFPGLALKILRPRLQLSLIEPNLKKAAFLSEVARRLRLDSVQVLRRRYEDISPGELAADWVTVRALGRYDKLLQWARGIVAGGKLVLWVGAETVNQVSGLPGWRFEEPVAIPASRQRFLLVGSPR